MRFTLPRDLYHGKDALESLKTLPGKKAIVVVGGGSMKRFGFLDKVEAYLKEAGITAMLTDVIAFRVAHATGSLSKAMHQLVEGEINIEYMYAFANGIDAAAVLKSDEPGRVVDILTGCGFTVYSADEAYSANV